MNMTELHAHILKLHLMHYIDSVFLITFIIVRSSLADDFLKRLICYRPVLYIDSIELHLVLLWPVDLDDLTFFT